MATTNAAMLDLVDAAIAATLKGQEYRLGDKWLTRADLNTLYSIRTDLQSKIQRSKGGAVATAVTFKHGGG
jgi:hypothetical protein